VILGRKGQGPLGVEWCPWPFWVIDTAYHVTVDTRSIELRYFYFLTKFIGLNHLKDGTSNPSLSRDFFGQQGVPLPPLPVQRRIAGILSAYDDLIENNQRRIQVLETMARALYREWFVEFRFPGRNELSHIENPRHHAAQDWALTDLARVCVEGIGIQTGPFGSQLHQSDYTDDGVPVVMPKDLVGFRIGTDTIARIPEQTAEKLSRHRMLPGDIVYGRRGDIGRRA
jgi:type I restriction enzyme, S subunit